MAHTIRLYKKPNALNFSLNPLPISFYISNFNSNNVAARHRVHLTILFSKNIGEANFKEIWSGIVGPDAGGFATIDISSVLDAQLEYFTPNVNIVKVHTCEGQCGQFKLRYYLVDNEAQLSQEYNSPIYNVYKGGVAKEDIDNAASYLNTTIYTNRAPLHYYIAPEFIRENQPKWMYFIYKIAAGIQAYVLNAEITSYQEDGWVNTHTAFAHSFNPVDGQVYCIPVDMASMAIDANAADADLVDRYTIELQDQSPENIISITFTIDRRPMYNPTHLLYRNSLGGLETLSLLGESEFAIDVAANKFESIPLPNLMGDVLVQREIADVRNTHNNPTKANTGWMLKGHFLRLADLFLNRQVWRVYGKRLIPAYVTAGQIVMHNSNTKLYSVPVDYSNAYADENYNPEGIVPFTDICPAVEFLWAEQVKSGYMQVQWKLPPGYYKLQLNYKINAGATITIYLNGTEGVASIDINSASNTAIVSANVEFTGRVVCNNDVEPFSFGPYTSAAFIDIESIIAPIAANYVADIGDRNLSPRLLQLSGQNLMVLQNAIATSASPLYGGGVYNSIGTVSTNQSANGAVAIINANNELYYQPTSGSVGNLAEDIIYYKIYEDIPTYGFMFSNLAQIRVPLKGTIPKVYVKMAFQNIQTIDYKYGLFSLYTAQAMIVDVYLQFFRDADCLIPIDVTTFGITIAYQQLLYSITRGTVGQVTGSTASSVELNVNVNATGKSMQIRSQLYHRKWLSGTTTMEYRDIVSNLAGTLGDVVFVGW